MGTTSASLCQGIRTERWSALNRSQLKWPTTCEESMTRSTSTPASSMELSPQTSCPSSCWIAQDLAASQSSSTTRLRNWSQVQKEGRSRKRRSRVGLEQQWPISRGFNDPNGSGNAIMKSPLPFKKMGPCVWGGGTGGVYCIAP